MNAEPVTPNFEPATSDTSPSAFSQVAVVGAVTMTLAGVSLLVTLVLILSLWIPSWVATLATTLLLTATSLAVFASANPASRLRGPLNRTGHAAPPVAPVSDGDGLPRSTDRAFRGGTLTGDAAQQFEPMQQFDPVQQLEPVQSSAVVQAIEIVEFEDAPPENDDQETTVVRHVAMLMDRGERSGSGPPSTRPMFQKATQPSIAR